MHPFETLAQTQEALDGLTDREEPLVALLERQPGRKEARYGQLLVDARHSPAMPPSAHGAQQVEGAQPEQGAQPAPQPVPDGLTLAGLAREVELLRAEVAGLRAQMDGAGEATEDGSGEVAERD
jgi:uncharacterized protein YceH (UPF0502 family)